MADAEQASLDRNLIRRYLAVLGVAKGEPNLNLLQQLVAAQVMRVPFENVSKLFYKKHLNLTGPPSLEQYLDGIEKHHFGGTCYASNYYFYRLLAGLGYEAKLCGADMATPDVHIVSMLRVDGREYLVDVGYAAPFLAALPRDVRSDWLIELGRDRYVLKPQDASGCSRLELYRDGALKHGYLAKPAPRKLDEFRAVIADSFRPSATFFNAILLARFCPNRSMVIHNLSLIEAEGRQSRTTRLRDRAELIATAHRYFDIPEEIVAEAVAELHNFEDAWT